MRPIPQWFPFPKDPPPSSVGIIENVYASMWYLAWHHYRKRTITIVLVSLLFTPLHPAIPVVVIALYFGYIYELVERWFMQQFAKASNLAYQDSAPFESVQGRLFSQGHSRAITHVISGSYASHPMRIFHYTYETGSGKSSRTYRFTVFEVTFEKTNFPHILLQSRSMHKYGSADRSGEVQDSEISRGEEIRKTFKLFATDGYEIEVLQIFTPDILRFLRHKGTHLSIEFAEHKLYIYDDLYIKRKKQLDEMYAVAKALFDVTGPLLNRLYDDFAALHPYYKDKE